MTQYDETNRKRGERVKMLLKREKISQKELKRRLLGLPPKTEVNTADICAICKGKKPLTEGMAKRIVALFPGRNYRVSWLMGYDDYMTEGMFWHETQYKPLLEARKETERICKAVASMMGSCGLTWDGDATARIRPASDGPIEYEGIRCEYIAPHTVDYQGATFETWELAAIAYKVFANLKSELNHAVMLKKMENDIMSRQPVELRIGGR